MIDGETEEEVEKDDQEKKSPIKLNALSSDLSKIFNQNTAFENARSSHLPEIITPPPEKGIL